MWQMGTDLLETVKDNDTSNKLRQDAVNVLDLLKNKLEGDEKIEMDFRETVDAQLLFWLPEGVQLVTIEVSPISLFLYVFRSPQRLLLLPQLLWPSSPWRRRRRPSLCIPISQMLLFQRPSFK